MRTLKEMKAEHPVIAQLKNNEGGWLDEHIAATTRFNAQFIEHMAQDLEHLSSGDNEPYAEPECVEIWFGIQFPLSTIDFRILGASERGVWIDSGDGRIGSHAVMVPWTSIFAIHIHSDKAVKRDDDQ